MFSKYILIIISFSILSLGGSLSKIEKDMLKSYNDGNISIGINLAEDLIQHRDSNLSNIGYQILIDISLTDNPIAPRILGNYLINDEHECKKGLTFLFIAVKRDNIEAIKDLAYLFKDSKCFNKNQIKFDKYLNIYRIQKKKSIAQKL